MSGNFNFFRGRSHNSSSIPVLSKPEKLMSMKLVPKIAHRYSPAAFNPQDIPMKYTFNFRYVLHSSVEGTFSYPNPSKGTWLIRKFCEKAKEGKDLDVIHREIAGEAEENMDAQR